MDAKTLNEWYKETHMFFYLDYYNNGKLKEAKGIVGNHIIEPTTEVVKDYIKNCKRKLKNDIYVETCYNPREKNITSFKKITKAEYDRHNGWENL